MLFRSVGIEFASMTFASSNNKYYGVNLHINRSVSVFKSTLNKLTARKRFTHFIGFGHVHVNTIHVGYTFSQYNTFLLLPIDEDRQ